ncbi:hypothetical protein GCK32_016825 [Trichostrongylus colubriformis]|uniref:DUF7778 domain-containing protein n=1 Tax=Trichostrongylus colubriformis TaxID=6319 RepID=A0AAN8IQA7_TRICO
MVKPTLKTEIGPPMSTISTEVVFHLPEKTPNVRLSGMLQCCFKKKRRFFRRTGKIRLLKVCLTKRDNLIIYRKKDKGKMVCRYRLVFDIGTVNLFLANGYIPVWRDALDEIIDKYSRSQYTLPFDDKLMEID